MKQFAFTAEELFCIAALAKKRIMYGVPNAFGADRQMQMQDTMDTLLHSQIAAMDMDGNLTLSAEYHEIVNFLCGCSRCVTINHQQENTQIGYVIWKYADRYLIAEVIGRKYMFSFADPTFVQTIFDSLVSSKATPMQNSETVVPQIALKKAYRLCTDGQGEDAIRLLRQHGADERMASVIASGLSGKARFIKVLHMVPILDTCKKTENAYLLLPNVCLELGQTVQNLRSCSVFTEIDSATMNKKIMAVAQAFLQE